MGAVKLEILDDIFRLQKVGDNFLKMSEKGSAGLYRFGFNGQEKDDEVFGSTGTSYTAEFWQYDSRIGRRWNLDPKPNPSISQYATFACNPIMYSDVLGDTIVDKKGNAVDISQDNNGKTSYTFNHKDGYSDKKKARIERQFMKKSAPVVDAMSKTGLGMQDINDMMSMETKVKLKYVNRSGGNTMGDTKGWGRTADGHYKKARIRLYGNTLKGSVMSGNYSSEEEAAHAIGAHERIHLNPTQIKLDNDMTLKYYQKEQATYHHQIKAIDAYWSKYGKTGNSRIKIKISHFMKTGQMIK